MKKCAVALAAAVLSLTACATGPYGLVTGPLQRSAVPEDHGVVVVAVDGTMVTFDQKRLKLAPGPHLLQMATTRRGLGGQQAFQSVALRVEPCVQYEFVARHDDRLSARTWRPVLVSESKIGACSMGK